MIPDRVCPTRHGDATTRHDALEKFVVCQQEDFARFVEARFRVAPPITATYISAVSNTKVTIISRTNGGDFEKLIGYGFELGGRRPMSKTDEFFEVTPISSRDTEVSKS